MNQRRLKTRIKTTQVKTDKGVSDCPGKPSRIVHKYSESYLQERVCMSKNSGKNMFEERVNFGKEVYCSCEIYHIERKIWNLAGGTFERQGKEVSGAISLYLLFTFPCIGENNESLCLIIFNTLPLKTYNSYGSTHSSNFHFVYLFQFNFIHFSSIFFTQYH